DHEIDLYERHPGPDVLARYEDFLQQEFPPQVAQEIESRIQMLPLPFDEVRLALPGIIRESVRESFESFRALLYPLLLSLPRGSGTPSDEGYFSLGQATRDASSGTHSHRSQNS